jgi:hypothetical protein
MTDTHKELMALADEISHMAGMEDDTRKWERLIDFTERLRALASRQGEDEEQLRAHTPPPWFCPRCGAIEVMRERRPDGNATCGNGHVYPMRETVRTKPAATTDRPAKESECPAEFRAPAMSAEERQVAYARITAKLRESTTKSAPAGGDAKDAARLDWLDANGFTAYRAIDPLDGLSKHCVVVHETQRPRRGNVADTIRQAIDAAMREGGG